MAIFDDMVFEMSEVQDHELIPLITTEDEENIENGNTPSDISILPLRNTVLFPGVVIPITVGRDKSIRLIQDANSKDKLIGVISQKDQEIEEPNFEDLNEIGTIAKIIKMLKMPDGSSTVIIQGQSKFKLIELVQTEPFMRAKIEAFPEIKPKETDELKAMIETLKDMSLKIIQQSPNIPSEAGVAIKNIESLSFLVNFISSNMNAEVENKQKLLEIAELEKRAHRVLEHLGEELKMLEMKNEIQSKVKVDIDRQQREYFLNQQMKQIQDELGSNPIAEDIAEKKNRALDKEWPEEVEEAFLKELAKLERMNPQSAEFSVQANYVDVLLDLPWNEYSDDNFDLKKRPRSIGSRPLWPGKSKRANHRTFGCSEDQRRHESPNTLLIRASRRRKNISREIGGRSTRKKIRAHVSRWPSRCW
jgi:ATP-dependent Lon protease